MQKDEQDSKRKRYAYYLSCWREADGSWRYALAPVDGRALPRRGFPNQDELLVYLKSVLPGEDG
jgi:hypothetical protein